LSRWLADAYAMIGFYPSAPNFTAGARALLENESGEVAVAATTVWEICIKTARGKLVDIHSGGHATLSGMLETHGFDLLALDAGTAEHAARLPALHANPFDRALVALAQRTGRTVLASDAIVGHYGVLVSW
jgi:PIN domain nuclease of toxin-antitoxin system